MTEPWYKDAIRMLRDGYGVEDIGVALSIPADHVRTLVACLRRSGRLLWVLGVADD